MHSRPQRLCSFWSAPRITTSEKVQFSEDVQRIHSVFLANQICQICSEHAQRERKSVNCRLLVLDIPRGHDSWCWLTSLQVNRYNFWRLKCQKLRLFCRLVADQKECGLWGREWRRWQFILCQHWKDSYAFLL